MAWLPYIERVFSFWTGHWLFLVWLAYIWPGRCVFSFGHLTISLFSFLIVARALFTFGLAGLHLARALSTFGLVALHLAWVLLICGYGIVYFWVGLPTFGHGLVYFWRGCLAFSLGLLYVSMGYR